MKVTDMHGKIVKIGDHVRKHSIIKNETSSYKEGVVKHVGPTHANGEDMIWTGSGGAHHPLACVVINQGEASE